MAGRSSCFSQTPTRPTRTGGESRAALFFERLLGQARRAARCAAPPPTRLLDSCACLCAMWSTGGASRAQGRALRTQKGADSTDRSEMQTAAHGRGALAGLERRRRRLCATQRAAVDTAPLTLLLRSSTLLPRLCSSDSAPAPAPAPNSCQRTSPARRRRTRVVLRARQRRDELPPAAVERAALRLGAGARGRARPDVHRAGRVAERRAGDDRLADAVPRPRAVGDDRGRQRRHAAALLPLLRDAQPVRRARGAGAGEGGLARLSGPLSAATHRRCCCRRCCAGRGASGSSRS